MATALTLWAVTSVGGLGLLMASAYTPDTPAEARPVWPAALTLDRRAGRWTLVVCLHPRCPCSDATLDALDGLLETRPDVNAVVLFALPDPAPPGWADSELVTRARRMPGLGVVPDPGGRTCAGFGARTSGQTFLYDADDRLTFVGGLTPGRGETGDTAGAACVARALAGGRPMAAVLRTDVFGCALYRADTIKGVP